MIHATHVTAATGVTGGFLCSAALGAIRFYQVWISPYKGYRCAHAAFHGGESCSGFGARVFGRYPFLFALRLLRRRFEHCRAAKGLMVTAMAANSAEPEMSGGDGDEPARAKKSRSCDPPCGCPFSIDADLTGGGGVDATAVPCDSCSGLDVFSCGFSCS